MAQAIANCSGAYRAQLLTIMFKNATLFKITLPQPMLIETLEEAAQAATFTPCGPTQERSTGWVPPRGHEHGALVEHVDGQLIMRLMIETKSVPARAIEAEAKERAAKTEAATGRKPGKKDMREIKDEVRQALLPHAFPSQTAVTVWIDAERGILVLDTASQSRADLVVTELVRLSVGPVVWRLGTQLTPTSVMSQWLLDDSELESAMAGFNIGRKCELKAADESKAVVRYTRHNLDTDEIKQHIRQGLMCTKLALTYNDRVSFVLTDDGVLTGLEFLDVVFEDHVALAADGFDADVAIAAGELTPLISDLIEALGGEVAP